MNEAAVSDVGRVGARVRVVGDALALKSIRGRVGVVVGVIPGTCSRLAVCVDNAEWDIDAAELEAVR